MQKHIPFFKPFFDIQEEKVIINCLKDVNSNLVEKFEQEFKQKFEFQDCAAVNSGTAALHIILYLLNLQPGSNILISDLTCVAVANVIENLNLTPIFADTCPKTGNISPNVLNFKKVKNNIKVIILDHNGGIPADIESFIDYGEKNNIPIIEDCAQSLGAEYKNKLCGKFGDISFFSFYVNKHITSAEGGMIVGNQRFIKKVKEVLMMNKERNENTLNYEKTTDKSERYSYEKEDKNYFDLFPFSYSMNNLSAAIGREQLKKADLFLNKRKQIARNYDKIFEKNSNFKKTKIFEDKNPSYQKYTLENTIGKNNIDLLVHSLHKKGIMIHKTNIPLHEYSFYKKKYKLNDLNYPNAMKYYNNMISLPIYPRLEYDDQKDIINEIIKYNPL